MWQFSFVEKDCNILFEELLIYKSYWMNSIRTYIAPNIYHASVYSMGSVWLVCKLRSLL